MKLTDEKKREIRDIFFSEGVHKFDEPTFFEYFEKKHYERFIPLAKWLKSKVNFKISASMISRVYRADVVLRQELQSLLWPLELTIATALSNFIENKSEKFDKNSVIDVLLDETLLEPIQNLGSRKEIMTYFQTQMFVEDSIKKILKRRKPESFYAIFREMALGQKISYLRLLSESNAQEILGTSKSKYHIIKFLEMVQALRNHIAHLNPLLGTKIHFEGKTQVFSIGECIVAANEIVDWELSTNLKEKIQKYFENSLKKLNKCNDCDPYSKENQFLDQEKLATKNAEIKFIHEKILETIFIK